MSEPNHTPGPWEYKTTPGSDHEFCTVYITDGKAIARHVLPADAQLIAAVPELLEACEAIVHAAKMGGVAATLAEAALAKANLKEVNQ